jgi:hypothetical protein
LKILSLSLINLSKGDHYEKIIGISLCNWCVGSRICNARIGLWRWWSLLVTFYLNSEYS